MKTDSLPWPVIRWMAAGVFYLLTVAIAFDQVRIREERISEMKAAAKEIQEGLNRIMQTTDQNILETEELIGRLEAEEQRKNEEVIRTLRRFSGER